MSPKESESIELRTLVAEQQIMRVIRRYCRSMDRIDAPLGYSVWHEDGVADYGPVFRGTGRQFIDWACDYHRTLEAQSHQVTNVLIDVRGEHAGSESYVTVGLLSRQHGRYQLNTVRGRYVDRWSCRDGRWAIDSRRYVHDFAFTREVEPHMGWGTRNPSDPSYEIFESP